MSDTQNLLETLGKNIENLLHDHDALDNVLASARNQNTWFTPENTRFALTHWRNSLTVQNIENWLQNYPKRPQQTKNIGIVAAGNIPLVGLHDVLCVLACGFTAQIKLSSTDAFLMRTVFGLMPDALQEKIQIVERLQSYDAIIATGSNNTARYFDYYFGKVPNIIRKSRSSAAILSGSETQEDITNLASDIFRYFGLGCRNVTKLFVPTGYDFTPFFRCIDGSHAEIANHHKYFNNYEYNLAVALINRTTHLGNAFLIVMENQQLKSPIGTLHYEYYTDSQDLEDKILAHHSELQCVAGDERLFASAVAFGSTQTPSLHTYADNIDTMQFLCSLAS